MATAKTAEIEFKFLIKKEQIDDVKAYVERCGAANETLALTNQYFDTPKRILHNHKIGLRIRRWNDQLEQTVKLAGEQIGAMSIRPEYNVPLQLSDVLNGVPNLALFPSDIWPATISIADLQINLQQQFQVDFERQRWLVKAAGATFEVAIDSGAIQAGALQEAICELEVELVDGDAEGLLAWANELQQQFSLPAGTLSKAQRGFVLAAQAAASSNVATSRGND